MPVVLDYRHSSSKSEDFEQQATGIIVRSLKASNSTCQMRGGYLSIGHKPGGLRERGLV